MRKILSLTIVLSVCNLLPAQDGRKMIKATGIKSGLAVHLGVTDGLLEVELARSGRMLVHGLALDERSLEKAREAIDATGLYGLASVEMTADIERLPYADNLVNLLIADIDKLGSYGSGDSEIERVLVPKGVAYLKKNGRWTKTVKARPVQMGEWTHWDHGADGNPVSRDQIVGPVTSLRWCSGPSISRAGSLQEAGLRIANGRIVYALKDYGIEDNQPRGAKNHLVCRDAYNGLLLWKIPIKAEKYTPYRHEFIVEGDRVYTFLETGGPMVVLDGATGKLVKSYNNGAIISEIEREQPNKQAYQKRHLVARLYDGKLFQAYKDRIYALDTESGRRLWIFGENEDGYIPLLVAGESKVFAVIGSEETIAMRGTVAIKVASIVCLEAQTGKELWRNRDFAGNYMVRLVFSHGYLPITYFSGSDRKGRKHEMPMTGYGHKFSMANIRAADGKTLWNQTELKSVGGHYAITFVRDGKAYVACERYIGYDLKTGIFDKGVGQRTFVNACAETRATPNYILYGMSFADREGMFSPRAIARSTCDTGVFPANGLVYSSPPLCACLDVIAGYIAAAREQTPKASPNERRLVRGKVQTKSIDKSRVWPARYEWPMFMANPKRGCWTTTEVADDAKRLWQIGIDDSSGGLLAEDRGEAEIMGDVITAPTVAEGRVYVGIPRRHRLESRDARTGELIWAFTAGAGIDSPPTIYGRMCLFGCRDGWMYALCAESGELIWKFQAGIYEKRIVANGRLESPWPVFGSVMIYEGKVCFTAGRHSSTDHGIQLYKLDAAMGKMEWNARIYSGVVDEIASGEIPVYSNHGKVGKYYPRAAHLLVSDGQQLHHFIETLKDSYTPGELVELFASNGRWDRVDPMRMNWLRSNMMGFISRRHESIGRFDYDGVRYSNLNADVIVLTDDSLYCVNGRQPKARNKYGQLTRVRLDAGGFIAQESEWKSQIRHHDGKREHSNFKVEAMVLAADTLFLAGYERYKASGALHVYSAKDGTKRAQWKLPGRPVRNGLAAARGRIYVSCDSGVLTCFGGP